MPLTCLIAAHDPWFIQLLRIYTEEMGLRVTQAFVGQDVLPMIHKESPSVILLQVDLPGQLKGWEVLNTLKADPTTNHIPILVFSWQSHRTVEDLAEGASAYLQEPVTYDSFVEALGKVGIYNLSQGMGGEDDQDENARLTPRAKEDEDHRLSLKN
jgi:CheY-like chemotaxis protein